jgi:hypothetical protein
LYINPVIVTGFGFFSLKVQPEGRNKRIVVLAFCSKDLEERDFFNARFKQGVL